MFLSEYIEETYSNLELYSIIKSDKTCRSTAVSYTHLDVYKRQAYNYVIYRYYNI